LASLKRNGIIIIMWQFLIPSKIPIVTLDCQVNQVMVMKTQEDTSQNLVSSNHNCDFPPNQKKNRATLQGRRIAAGRRQAYPRSTCCIQLLRKIGKIPKYLDEL
jgi:hypothetical protein